MFIIYILEAHASNEWPLTVDNYVIEKNHIFFMYIFLKLMF